MSMSGSGRYKKADRTTAGPSRPAYAETTGAEGQQIQFVRGHGGSLIKVVLHPPVKRKLVPKTPPVQDFFEHQGSFESSDKSLTEEKDPLALELPNPVTHNRRQRLGRDEENPFLPVPIDEEMNLVSTEAMDEAEHDDTEEELNLTGPNVDDDDHQPVSIGLCESDEEASYATGTELTAELSESGRTTSSSTNIAVAVASDIKFSNIHIQESDVDIPIVPDKRLSTTFSTTQDSDESCIVCNGELNRLNDPRKLNSVNLKVKHYFCQMMGIADADGMQISFDEEDAYPFCDACSAEVTNLISVGSKIESLHKQYDSLRDSLASRTVKTFFARTRPDLLQSMSIPDGESVDAEEEHDSNQTTSWERVAKEWKSVYDVNSPGQTISKPVTTEPIDTRSISISNFRLSYNEAANSTAFPEFSMDAPEYPAITEANELAPSTSTCITPLKTRSEIKIEIEDQPQPQPKFGNGNDVISGMEYRCSECPKAFPTSGLLAYHNRIHTGELPFECETCGKGFAVPHYLVIHMRTHTGERPFTCDICHKGFAQRGGLITHSLVHTGAKPFECDICHKKFRQRYHLTQHLLIHTGSKPFGCDICGKFFNVKMNLREHKRRHTGDRPYKCPHCVSIGFFRKRMLRDHIVKAHAGKELPPELANLGETRIPPSLTKEGRKAYKSSNAARRNRNRLMKKNLKMSEEPLPLQVNIIEGGSPPASKDTSTSDVPRNSSTGASSDPDLTSGSETNGLIIDTNTENKATTILC